MKKLILATASLLAFGIGSAAVTYAADMNPTAPNIQSNMPATAGTPQYSQTAVNPSKDEVRQAQQRLRDLGLYNGAIDGVLGQETKQALEKFQSSNGLSMTATLDQPTMDRLFGSTGISQGSSTPPLTGQGGGSIGGAQPGSAGTSGLGDHGTPQQ